jgi:HK97 family phage prohead protease
MNIDKLSLPAEVRERLGLDADGMAAAGLVGRTRATVAEFRRNPVEIRENDDGTYGLTGYALTWETPYDVAGGAPYGWTELIARGAVTKSLAERDDVRFLVNHEGLPLARTKSRTMTLEADDLGLLVNVPNLDARNNPFAAAFLSAVLRGDADQMSWAFQATRQAWNSDYTERTITEARMFDVSGVTYPANEATIIGARSVDPIAESATRGAMPLSLARAMADAL